MKFQTKSLVGKFALFLGFATLVSAAHAGFIVDTKIGEAKLDDSSIESEIATLQSFVPTETLLFGFKIDFSNTNPVSASQNAGTTDQWFLDVNPNTPGYFAVKFGIGSTRATADTFFFRNIGELTKLVWSNSDVQFLTGGDCREGKDNACNIGRLSHYVTASGKEIGVPPSGSVPEPTTVALLGLGLLGFAASRRMVKTALQP